MELRERYDVLLKQAITELGNTLVPGAPAPPQDLAPALGDVLYRLAIEHGLPFNDMRGDLIGSLSAAKPVAAGRKGAPAPTFSASLAPFHSLILLALEMMPADAPE